MALTRSNFLYSLVMMMMNLWSTSSIPSSALEVAENEDLLIQILLRLPVKSLARFKCVSKKWKSIISSRYFAITHTRRIPNPVSSSLLMLKNQSLILLSLGNDQINNGAGFRIPSFDFFNTTPDTTMRILCICNGLMLCFVTSAFRNYDNVYCVSNITTRRFNKLPPPGRIINKPILGINLAVDPTRSPHFKVICVGQSFMQNDRCCQIEIYSSETGMWKRWSGSFINPCHILEVFDRGVYCNGAVHWLCSRGDSFYFVIEDETMRVLPMPAVLRDLYTTKRLRFLGQSGGYLHLVDVEANLFHNPPMDVYEMVKDYGGWFLKYRINLDDLGVPFPDMIGQMHVNSQNSNDVNDITVHLTRYHLCSVLSVIRGQDGESVEIILLIPHRIISYNPKYKSIRVLLYFEENIEIQDYKWYDVYQFNETLSALPPY